MDDVINDLNKKIILVVGQLRISNKLASKKKKRISNKLQ